MQSSVRHTKWSPTAHKAFNLFLQRLFRHRLDELRFAGVPQFLPDAEPLVLASNHVSWWDGFLLLELYRRSGSRAPFYTIMLESELRKRPFLRKLGAIGITPGDPLSIRAVINFLVDARTQHGTFWLSYFPQGRIWPSSRRPLRFQPGIASFANRLAPATIWPIGLHLEPLNRLKPTAFVNVGDPIHASETIDSADVERAVTQTLDALLAHIDRYGEEAARTWPPSRTGRANPPLENEA